MPFREAALVGFLHGSDKGRITSSLRNATVYPILPCGIKGPYYECHVAVDRGYKKKELRAQGSERQRKENNVEARYLNKLRNGF